MWFVFLAVAIVWALTATAAADEPGRSDGRHERAFWLSSQAWPNPQDDAAGQPKPKFTMTYTEGVASRFHSGDGGGGFFAQKLGGAGAPALVGTMSHGAPVLELRWRTGE